jgi:hypothetical protein
MANPFEAALAEARKSLEKALEEKSAIERRIFSLKQTIEGLSSLCEPHSEEEFLISGDTPASFQLSSMTDAIRRVFSQSDEPILAPTEVRDALVAMGMDLGKYKQPLVPIHNTLKRLVSQEELVEFRDDKNELKGYRWVSPLARAVAEVEHPWMEKARETMRRKETINPAAFYGETPPSAGHPIQHLRNRNRQK